MGFSLPSGCSIRFVLDAPTTFYAVRASGRRDQMRHDVQNLERGLRRCASSAPPVAGRLRSQRSHSAETSHVALRLTEPGRQECLDEIPSYGRPHRSAAHANDVHMIVLDPLPSREVVVNQPGADAWDLVGANRRAHAAAADRDTMFYLPPGDGSGERNDEIRIIVERNQVMGTEIDDLILSRTELGSSSSLRSRSNPP